MTRTVKFLLIYMWCITLYLSSVTLTSLWKRKDPKNHLSLLYFYCSMRWKPNFTGWSGWLSQLETKQVKTWSRGGYLCISINRYFLEWVKWQNMRKVRKVPQVWIKLPLCSFLSEFKTERLFSRVPDISTHLNRSMSFPAFRLESVRTEWSQRETDSQQFWSSARMPEHFYYLHWEDQLRLKWKDIHGVQTMQNQNCFKNPQSFRAFPTEFYQILQRFHLKTGPWLTFLSSLCTKHIYVQIMLLILHLSNLS